MSKHTPGPWEYVFVNTWSPWKDSSIIRHREGGQEIIIARVFDKTGSFDNARLIVAAPEMLDKFREALRIITTQTPQHKINEFLKGAADLLRRIDGEGGSNG